MSMKGMTIQTIAIDEVAHFQAEREATSRWFAQQRALAEQAKTDPSLQCHHQVSLYDICLPCGAEAGEPAS